jgi:hypothetical protein
MKGCVLTRAVPLLIECGASINSTARVSKRSDISHDRLLTRAVLFFYGGLFARSALKSYFQALAAARDCDFEKRAAGGVERVNQICESVYRFRPRLDDHVARL